MGRRHTKPIAKRNALLAAAAICFLIAIIICPNPLAVLISTAGLAYLGMYALLGIIAARGIRAAAQEVLTTPGEPWYARGGAMLFVAFVLLLTNTLYVLGEGAVFCFLRRAIIFPKSSCIFLFTAMQLLWITVEDWPRDELDCYG